MDCPRQVQGSEGFRIGKKIIAKFRNIKYSAYICIVKRKHNAYYLTFNLFIMQVTLHPDKVAHFQEAHLRRVNGVFELELDGYYISFPNASDYCAVMEHLTVLFEAYEKGLTIKD